MGKGSGKVLRVKRWVCHQNPGKVAVSSRKSQNMHSPMGSFVQDINCASKVQVLPFRGDPSMVMKQRQLSDVLGLICTGAALVVRLEPVQGSGLSPSWTFLLKLFLWSGLCGFCLSFC